MYSIFSIGITGLRSALVQRHLVHTVDGVEMVVDRVDGAVLGTLQHHTAAEHTAHVGALDGVQRTTVVDVGHTIERPFALLAAIFVAIHQDVFALFYLVVYLEGLMAILPFLLLSLIHICQQTGMIVIGNLLTSLVGFADRFAILFISKGVKLLTLPVIERVFFGCHILQLIVGFLAIGQLFIVLQFQGFFQAVIVGAVVVDMQFTEAVDQCEVTVAIETTHLLSAEGDEVVVIDIAQRGCGVAIDGNRVGIEVVTTLGDVSTGKEGVVDGDASGVELFPFLLAFIILVSVLQLVQGLHGHVFAFRIGGFDTRCGIGSKATDTACGGDLAVRLYGDVTVA